MDDLLMIPGPTTLSSRVREALAQPQWSHSSPEFHDAFVDLLELTKYAFVTRDGFPYVITGSGTVAMEATAASLIEPGEKVLVLDTGHFGQRFALILELHGAKVDTLKFDLGKAADPGLVDSQLSKDNYKAVFVTHVDTGNTVKNAIGTITEAAHNHGSLAVVDSVCGIGGEELRFDDMGIDVAFTASQKAIGSPPGAGLIVLSKRALESMEGRKSPIRSYYFSLLRWKKVMEDPRVYLATPAVQIMLALRTALQEVKEEGIEKRWNRHNNQAAGLRAGIEALGLRLVAEEGARASTVTGFFTSESKEIQSIMRNRHGIQLARGLYEHADAMMRIGHFANLSPTGVASLLTALEMTLRKMGRDIRAGSALQAATPQLEIIS